ncbi:MAG TPA: hypothetical protein QF800_00705, partial [Phycisphaerales bacterium]|nr:hypothetical protein [Phycisphaerales bacterium]
MLQAMPAAVPIIDGHNDTLTQVFGPEGGGVNAFLCGNQDTDIDLPRARAGGLAAGFFALYIRAPEGLPTPEPERSDDGAWTFTPPAIGCDWAARE